MTVKNLSGVASEVMVLGAILCVACDLPAGRKLCGFLSHSARLGCSRCYKEFPGNASDRDYSGFDRTEWVLRTNHQHREDVKETIKATSQEQLRKKESQYGCRYSCLLELTYFDPVRMLAVDPMHNLYLGSGKHMLQLWIANGILGSVQLNSLQTKVDGIVTPADIGRSPYKIASGFSGFTADQFKNWITLFSIPAMYSIIPVPDFECWHCFVLACQILCKKTLKPEDVQLADALLCEGS